MRLLIPLLLFSLVDGAWCVVEDEVVRELISDLDEGELEAPRSAALAQRLAAFLEKPPAEAELAHCLRLRLAEAWLQGGEPEKALGVLTGLAGELDAAAANLRRRAGLALVDAWGQWESSGGAVPTLAERWAKLKAFAWDPPAVIARAWTVEGQHLLSDRKTAEALAAYDQALSVLAQEPARTRVPVYGLRQLAMEASGTSPEEILAWFEQHRQDPAVIQLGIFEDRGLVGKPSPALAAPVLAGPGQGAPFVWPQEPGPVLVYFFATWSKTSDAASTAVGKLLADPPAGLRVVAVSLDNADTRPALEGYLKLHGLTCAVVGQLRGWDGDLDKVWQVSAIPCVVLVGADGRVAGGRNLGPQPGAEIVALLANPRHAPARKPLVQPKMEEAIP